MHEIKTYEDEMHLVRMSFRIFDGRQWHGKTVICPNNCKQWITVDNERALIN